VVALLKYSVLRLALFVAALGGLAWAGANLMIAVVGAALVSMMLSYLLLRGPRDQLARVVADRTERRLVAAEQRIGAQAAEDAAIEDAADEAGRTAP